MSTVQITGPGVVSFTQPETPPIEASFVPVALSSIPIVPGPTVRFHYNPSPFGTQTIYPSVTAVFVPKAEVPADPKAITPAFLLDPAKVFPSATSVPGEVIESLYEVPVPGLIGGTEYTLFTVLEYNVPDPA